MIERLYGVNHGAVTRFGDAVLFDNLVAPSKDLMRDLLTLAPGTKIGIETSLELGHPVEIQGKVIDYLKSNKFYWNKIQGLCQRRGLEIVYLEDFETYKRYLEKVMELEPLNTALVTELTTGGVPERVMQQIYRVQTEADYLFVFEREEKIFDRIRETQPDIVILGRGHTDPLLVDPEAFSRRGISVGEQKTEEVFFPPWHWDVPEKGFERAYIAWQPEPDEKLLLERTLIKRRYRAITEGRVMEGKTPDFIGTWDTQVPARGLFELYLESNGVKGVIEDCLGTATFVGVISSRSTTFIKEYDTSKSGEKAVRGQVFYEGGRSSLALEEIFGVFRSPYIDEGSFRIKKFDGTPYPVNF